MDENASTNPWTSITGEPLQLDLPTGFLGLDTLVETNNETNVREGNCRSVSSYEKLNQLGEGSTHPDNLTRFPGSSTDT